MKKFLSCILIFILLITCCSACGKKNTDSKEIKINLSDASITVDNKNITTDTSNAVYSANDIVYYQSGNDFTYGEGNPSDAHEQGEADAHTVVHISQPGKYVLSGKLSAGQIAIDLGKEAKDNPESVVTLVLNNVDISCSVAPAIIFYNVYECGNDNPNTANKDVDTSAAGANVIIADGSKNTVNGSYVARIYKPDSIVLTEDKTQVESFEKLHKYDAAFYSKQTMNIGGEKRGNGILNINAENEGLDSELHLTINGGIINITSGNDGINTNEDNVSVTTINDGTVNILCNGTTGEGDGIDSNGWLVINGGNVVAQACATSGDSGIDSDMGIYLNGGCVTASGNMLDSIAGGKQTYAIFRFANRQNGDSKYTLKNKDGNVVGKYAPTNDFTYLLITDDKLTTGDYTFWQDNTQLAAETINITNMPNRPQKPDGFGGQNNGGKDFYDGQQPQKPEKDASSKPDYSNGKPIGELPEKPNIKPEMDIPQQPNPSPNNPEDFQGAPNEEFGMSNSNSSINSDNLSLIFKIKNGGNQFINILPAPTDKE